MEADSEKHWYILKSLAGSEKKIIQIIRLRLKQEKMEHLIEEIFVPSETVQVKKNGKDSKKTIMYYPGYILIKMCLTDELWHLLRDVPKISGFVGGEKKKPRPASESELAAIKLQIEQGTHQATIDSTYQIGQIVQIMEGPFAEFNGTIEAVDSERNKVTVLISIFGRSTPIELGFDRIKINQ